MKYDFYKSKWRAFGLGRIGIFLILPILFSCESERYTEDRVRVLVPDPLIESPADRLADAGSASQAASSGEPKPQTTPSDPNGAPQTAPPETSKVEKKTAPPAIKGAVKPVKPKKSEEDELVIRETLNSEWREIIKMAQDRTLDRQDINYYVPLAQGIENYINYGELGEAARRIREIKDAILKVEMQAKHIRGKISRANIKLQRSELPKDQIKEFSEILLRAERLLQSDQAAQANAIVNELWTDYQASEKVNRALDTEKQPESPAASDTKVTPSSPSSAETELVPLIETKTIEPKDPTEDARETLETPQAPQP